MSAEMTAGTYMDDRDVAEALLSLQPELRAEVVRRAAEWGVSRTLDDMASCGELAGLGEDAISVLAREAVDRVLEPMLPMLGEKLLAIAGPAAEKAAAVVQPALASELEKRLPVFAVITGLVAGALTVLGMLLVGTAVVRKVR